MFDRERQRILDRHLNVEFYWDTWPDGEASKREGREIKSPIEMVHIRIAGDRQGDSIQRAHAHFEYDRDGNSVTQAMRFEDQYRRFRASDQQIVGGTPVASMEWLNGAQKAMLKALAIHTVEQLADLSGERLKNIGVGGFALKEAAENYIKTTKDGAEVTNLVAENAALKEAMAALAVGGGVDPRVKYAEMPDHDLKDAIKEKTGEFPRGNPSRTTLIRMLVEADRGVAPVQAEAQAA